MTNLFTQTLGSMAGNFFARRVTDSSIHSDAKEAINRANELKAANRQILAAQTSYELSKRANDIRV